MKFAIFIVLSFEKIPDAMDRRGRKWRDAGFGHSRRAIIIHAGINVVFAVNDVAVCPRGRSPGNIRRRISSSTTGAAGERRPARAGSANVEPRGPRGGRLGHGATEAAAKSPADRSPARPDENRRLARRLLPAERPNAAPADAPAPDNPLQRRRRCAALQWLRTLSQSNYRACARDCK
jgi:hypothetical protein